MIQKSIRMTSKGTFTLPVSVRKELGLKVPGDKLMLTFRPGSHTVELQKAPDFASLREKFRHLATDTSFDIESAREQRHAEAARKHLS